MTLYTLNTCVIKCFSSQSVLQLLPNDETYSW